MEGRILLSGSSQGESSVMRDLRVVKKTHYEYTLAHYEYTLGGNDVYSTSTNAYLLLIMVFFTTLIGLVHIHNGFFMTLSLTLNTELSP